MTKLEKIKLIEQAFRKHFWNSCPEVVGIKATEEILYILYVAPPGNIKYSGQYDLFKLMFYKNSPFFDMLTKMKLNLEFKIELVPANSWIYPSHEIGNLLN